jgi:hypothetical protein
VITAVAGPAVVIVFEGALADLLAARSALTCEHLADYAGTRRAGQERRPRPIGTRISIHKNLDFGLSLVETATRVPS